jgi:hypothetical protein
LMSCALFWQLSCNLLLCTQIGLISDYLNEARGYKMLQVLSRVAAVSECELYCRIDSEGWNGGMVRKYYLISLIWWFWNFFFGFSWWFVWTCSEYDSDVRNTEILVPAVKKIVPRLNYCDSYVGRHFTRETKQKCNNTRGENVNIVRKIPGVLCLLIWTILQVACIYYLGCSLSKSYSVYKKSYIKLY